GDDELLDWLLVELVLPDDCELPEELEFRDDCELLEEPELPEDSELLEEPELPEDSELLEEDRLLEELELLLEELELLDELLLEEDIQIAPGYRTPTPRPKMERRSGEKAELNLGSHIPYTASSLDGQVIASDFGFQHRQR